MSTDSRLAHSAQLSPRWQILANLGYLDAQQVSQNPVNNGNRLMLTPELSGSLWTTYAFPGTPDGRWRRSLHGRCVREPREHDRVPGYSVVDAMVEYGVNRHLSLG